MMFDTENPEFARGFEAGRIWEALEAHPLAEVSETVHASNAEMFIRMGESLGRSVRCEELDETWLEIFFGLAEEEVEA